jgi:hypothetical protein
MGQAILYCFRCSTQLRDSHFEQGKAYRIDNFAVCAACAPEAAHSLPPESVQKLQDLISGKDKKGSGASQRKTGAALPAIRDSSRAHLAITSSSTVTPSVARPPINPWILVGGVGGAVVLLVAIVLLSQGGTPTPAVEPPTPPGVPPPVVKIGASESPAQAALKKAARYAQDHPQDLDGQIREYSDLVLLADQGDCGAEARRKIEVLRARDNEAVHRGLESLETEISALLTPAKYADAIGIVESAKGRMASTAWKLAVEKRASELRTLLAETKKPVVPPPLPPPPPPRPATRTAEGKGYDAVWGKAMAKATARDYEAAAADLKQASAALKEDELRREAAQDVADLEELGRVYKATLAAAAAARSVDLTVASGRVLSGDADRIELFVEPKKPTVFLEWLDVRADALVPLLKLQSADPRLPMLFAVLDGRPDSTDGLAPKYATYKATPPKAPEGEATARDLYYGAERDWRSMETREKSVEAYRTLKLKHKDTLLVRREQARIDRRSEFGKEYYFTGPDFAFAGTFAPMKEQRLESIADSDPSQASRNWAEVEYAPFPSSTYRCWVLVGGCCVETFTFYYQATGLSETNPKTKKRSPADPGSDLAIPLRPPIKGLKPTHAKNEPKKPIRWEWVEIPVPKLSTPGTRRVRFLTDQRGFAIAAVIVSANRSKPPTEVEAAELGRTRELDETPPWALDRPGNSPRVLIDDFEGAGPSTWGWVGGWEFPGATGSYAVDSTTAHDGKASGKIVADFTGGGAYVGGWRDLAKISSRNFKEIRLWIKAPTVKAIGVRLADATNQIHQREVHLSLSPDWQEVVLKPKEMAGGEHWGGANDGVWHAPIKAFGINVGKGSLSQDLKKGELWIDDIEGILDLEDPQK